MNYQTRLGEYLPPETAPVGSGQANRAYDQLDLSDFKEAPVTFDSISAPDKRDNRATGEVTRTLDALLKEGTPLTSDRMVKECEEKNVALGTININTANITDVEAVTGVIRNLLRKSDHVYSNKGSIMILAPVSDQKGLYIVLNKIKNVIDASRECDMGSATHNDIHMTYQQDPQFVERELVDLNLPEGGVELWDIAMGYETFDPTKQVYLSSSGKLEDVKNYINVVHALNPTLLQELEIVFAMTNQFAQLNYSRLDEEDVDFDDPPFEQKWSLQRYNLKHGDRYFETELDHLIDEERFVVIGYEPGKPFVYKAEDKKIVPKEE